MRKKYKGITFFLAIIYILFLIYILFMRSRNIWGDASYKEYIRAFFNIVPLRTICKLLAKMRAGLLPAYIVAKNIIGNIILFMPAAFLCYKIWKWSIHRYVFVQTAVLVIVEVIQLLLRTGSCDIDDIILNLAGCIPVYCLLARYNRNHDRLS